MVTIISRRAILQQLTGLFSAAGAIFLSIPFIGSMAPSMRAKSRGGPIKVDVSSLEPGQQLTTMWRGKPVWIIRRTTEMLDDLNDDKLISNLLDPYSNTVTQQPNYTKNDLRSIDPNYLVVVGLCTHLGCIPNKKPKGELVRDKSWKGGFFCPCHGSKFDYAGRVYKNVPAPTNLVIPPHLFQESKVIVVGSEKPD